MSVANTVAEMEAKRAARAALYEKNAAIVANLEGTPQALFEVIHTHAKEVLAHPCLDLFAIESPEIVLDLRYAARHQVVSDALEPLEQFPVNAVRRVACEAVQEVLHLWGNWRPRIVSVDAKVLHPTYAIEVALAACDGKVSAYSLSWASRFAHSFKEYREFVDKKTRQRKKNVTEEMVQWHRAANELTYLCGGVCAPTRNELWRIISKAIGHSSEDKIVQVTALERHAARLLSLGAKKKKKKEAK